MTNENILSQPAQDQNNHNHRGKDIKLSPSSAILYPLHLYNFITSHINYLILFKYNYNLARSSWIDHNKHTPPCVINDAHRFYRYILGYFRKKKRTAARTSRPITWYFGSVGKIPHYNRCKNYVNKHIEESLEIALCCPCRWIQWWLHWIVSSASNWQYNLTHHSQRLHKNICFCATTDSTATFFSLSLYQEKLNEREDLQHM